ncbi:heterokaryon incompatibility protein-domain-containing protein [Phaeosphaeriaceae sp. PMI808]|nr:heterokaryon incompatibility protein-domain-containing protein [Phaeosphaeriaceae sp. PMI808]
MLCKICVGMLRGGRGDIWVGTHDLTFDHHKTTTTLRRSREADCSICIALANILRHEFDLLEDRPISIRATLHKLPRDQSRKAQFQLNFELERKHTRIFLLKETGPEKRQLRTPRSLDTSSDEVFEVAQSWIKDCRCADFWERPGEKWYPKRLLDLEELRGANGLTEEDGLTILSEHSDLERRRVFLIETKEVIRQQTVEGKNTVFMKLREGSKNKIREQENDRYITLSHCWGKPKSATGQLRLSSKTEERFKKEGIELRELPKTFRDAMLFACRLEKVGFLWIDSLCIRQRVSDLSSEAQKGPEDDWLEQSREMDKIYLQSFLNISATAAMDGDKGLFVNRRPEYLWEDEINVNNTGTNLFGSTRTGSMKRDELTRCTLIDVSFWDDLVEHAPVNRRGWVLQERLMAPECYISAVIRLHGNVRNSKTPKATRR